MNLPATGLKDQFRHRSRAFFECLLLLIFAMVLCPLDVRAEDCDYDKTFDREDKTIFGRDCGVCHSIAGPWEKPGGSLGGIFTRKQLRSGEPVTEETVRKTIAEGGRGMPGFRYTLTPVQIEELVDYLKTVKCPPDPAQQKALEEARTTQRNSQAGTSGKGETRETRD